MIPRTAARRSPSSGLVITPRSGGEDLPAWSPVHPRGGWTPAAAFRASVDYVAALDRREGVASDRRLVLVAYRDLLARLPDKKRAQVVERLRGVDHAAAYFAEPVVEPEDALPAPPC